MCLPADRKQDKEQQETREKKRKQNGSLKGEAPSLTIRHKDNQHPSKSDNKNMLPYNINNFE
jgi:hypothetical protein